MEIMALTNCNPTTSTPSKRAIQTSFFLACLLAAVNGFTVPQKPASHLALSRQATSLRLRRRFGSEEWISRQKHRLNQSTYTLGQQQGGVVDEDAEVGLEEMMRRRRIQRAAALRTQKTSKKPETPEGKAVTLTSSTMNLIKTILGTGVLALPAGLAAVSDMPYALVPASALLLVLGGLSAYTFQLYGRLTHATQAKSMGEIWEKTVGRKSSWVISAATLSFCYGCALTYSLVIGDFLSSLAMSLGSGVPALFTHRQFWILSVTLSTLLPLSNLKSLAALAPMSILGTFGTLLTTIFMAIRCPAIVSGSPYSVAPGAIGRFAATAAPSLAPKFGTFSQIISPAALIIASMATTAYLGHFNAPALYHGLKEPQSATDTASVVSDTSNSSDKAMNKYRIMTGVGFVGTTLLNIIILSLGFLTFGGNSQGVILNNYATADKGAILSRLLMTISVIGSYPFMVGGCKSSFMQIYNNIKKGKRAPQAKVEKWVVGGVLASVTSLALLLNDAGLCVSLNGALMGSSIIYVFPTLMFLSHTGKQIRAAGGTVSRKLKLERFVGRFLATFGVVSGLIGAAVSVINSCAPHLLR